MEGYLYQHLYRSYQLLQLFIQHNQTIENPIMVRLSSVLHQQQVMLYQSLMLLQQNPRDEKKLRFSLEVVFMSDEVVNPLFRGWKRSSKWMELVSKERLQWKATIIKEIRRELVLTVPAIEQKYGKQDAKYIIPPLIRSQYHYHVKGGE